MEMDDYTLMRREIRFLAYTNLALILVIVCFVVILLLWSQRTEPLPASITQEATPAIPLDTKVDAD